MGSNDYYRVANIARGKGKMLINNSNNLFLISACASNDFFNNVPLANAASGKEKSMDGVKKYINS